MEDGNPVGKGNKHFLLLQSFNNLSYSVEDKFFIQMTLNSLYTNAFNLDRSKFLSFGKEFMYLHD